MEKHPLRESAWRRGWNDTRTQWTSWLFVILNAVVSIALFLIGFFVLAWYWGVGLAISPFLGVWVYETVSAPHKQRNEARELVEQQRKPSDSEVTDAIRLLGVETLVLKNNGGEKCSYSFSQVFLALADQLSIGLTSNEFEGKIIKGLNLDARGGWYFPYKDDGITHLIGVLVQNVLVERRNEEYQRMIRDYPLDPNEAVYELLMKGKNMFRPEPPQHLEKGTEVKYYLSPLGSRVIQRLRPLP